MVRFLLESEALTTGLPYRSLARSLCGEAPKPGELLPKQKLETHHPPEGL